MKLIVVAEVVGRKALHRYGHPIRFKVTEDTISNKVNFILNKWEKTGRDITTYKAIYSINKFRILRARERDIVNTFVMAVDDNCEKVYKFCPIKGCRMSLSSFNEKFNELGLYLNYNMTEREDRESVKMLFDHKGIDILNAIFEYYGTISDSVYEQFIANHFDLLLEQYLDHSHITTMSSLIWTCIDKKLIYNYLNNKKSKLSQKTVTNIIDILHTAIFLERINIILSRAPLIRKSNSTISINEYEEQLKRKQEAEICDALNTIFTFFDKYLNNYYIECDRQTAELENFFTAAYYLMGKPDFPNSENLNYIKRLTYHNLSLINRDSFNAASSFVPYLKHLDRIFERLSNEELIELFRFKEFDPFKSVAVGERYEDSNNLRWISKDKKNLDLFNNLRSRDKLLKRVIDSRYKIAETRNSICAINAVNSFETSMFFIYMQSNYSLFMKDILLVENIINMNSVISILKRLDCSKFINEKIKSEFISILLIRLESKHSLEDLKNYFRKAKDNDGKKVDKELIETIKNSSFSKLKGAVKCNRL